MLRPEKKLHRYDSPWQSQTAERVTLETLSLGVSFLLTEDPGFIL